MYTQHLKVTAYWAHGLDNCYANHCIRGEISSISVMCMNIFKVCFELGIQWGHEIKKFKEISSIRWDSRLIMAPNSNILLSQEELGIDNCCQKLSIFLCFFLPLRFFCCSLLIKKGVNSIHTLPQFCPHCHRLRVTCTATMLLKLLQCFSPLLDSLFSKCRIVVCPNC